LSARVSTGKQERQETVASPVDALQQAAAARGDAVLPEYVFVDEGWSGAGLDRPALDRWRDSAPDGAFEAVLVCVPDRQARQYAYQVVVLGELRRAGVEVVFLNHAFDDRPEQQLLLLLQIQGVLAEYERALIQERTAAAGCSRRARGGSPGRRRPLATAWSSRPSTRPSTWSYTRRRRLWCGSWTPGWSTSSSAPTRSLSG
jgi:site-specific DNA recombinase